MAWINGASAAASSADPSAPAISSVVACTRDANARRSKYARVPPTRTFPFRMQPQVVVDLFSGYALVRRARLTVSYSRAAYTPMSHLGGQRRRRVRQVVADGRDARAVNFGRLARYTTRARSRPRCPGTRSPPGRRCRRSAGPGTRRRRAGPPAAAHARRCKCDVLPPLPVGRPCGTRSVTLP